MAVAELGRGEILRREDHGDFVELPGDQSGRKASARNAALR